MNCSEKHQVSHVIHHGRCLALDNKAHESLEQEGPQRHKHLINYVRKYTHTSVYLPKALKQLSV